MRSMSWDQCNKVGIAYYVFWYGVGSWDAFPLGWVGADSSMGLWCPHTTPRQRRHEDCWCAAVWATGLGIFIWAASVLSSLGMRPWKITSVTVFVGWTYYCYFWSVRLQRMLSFVHVVKFDNYDEWKKNRFLTFPISMNGDWSEFYLSVSISIIPSPKPVSVKGK